MLYYNVWFLYDIIDKCVKLFFAACENSMYFVRAYIFTFFNQCKKSHEELYVNLIGNLSSFFTKEQKIKNVINKVPTSNKNTEISRKKLYYV